MGKKTYFQVTGCIFAVVGFFHLVRVFGGYNLIYNDWQIPVWMSFVAGVILWYLSYTAFKMGGKKR